jgi:hypothetical protein
MLTKSKVLKYIKRNLGFPYEALEITDDEIMDQLIDFTIPSFSFYWPDENTIAFNFSKRLPNAPSNEYLIEEPDGREIIRVISLIPGSNYSVAGHPSVGITGDPIEWVYKVRKASPKLSWGFQKFSWEFKAPNTIRIEGSNPGTCAMVYGRVHADDFSTITLPMQEYFLPFIVADLKIWIGNIRKKYTELSTPYGNIPLSDIRDEGKSDKQDILEKLKMKNMDIVIHIGQ